MPLSEAEFVEGLNSVIEYPLAALVSRLRRNATQALTTDYIDEARVNFHNALVSIIFNAIKVAETEGIDWQK